MNRVIHFEIQADDLDRAQKFYEAVFGWKFQETGPGFGGYRIVMTGPSPDVLVKGGTVTLEDWGINGGLMKRMGSQPAEGCSPNAYTCIVAVDDIDAYIKKADAAGGRAQTDKMQVPTVGWLRYYRDTEGNLFGILQPEMPDK
jgi:predicted enzyme related to lactoylglutathione lyase